MLELRDREVDGRELIGGRDLGAHVMAVTLERHLADLASRDRAGCALR